MDSESLPDNVIPQDIMLQINEPEDNLQTKKHIAEDGSTSTLWKHFKGKHNELYLEINQITEALNKLEISQSLAFTQESFRNDLVHWIIVDDQPFTVVQNTFFQKMIKRLNSNAIIPSSDTIHNDIIKIFNDEKEFLKNKLQKLSGKIFLTLDGWTTVLDFSHLEGPHSGENIASKLFEVLKEFNLLSKILGISTDNAFNMDKMFNKFEYICNYEGIKFDADNQRVRCLAHIINLAVQNILKALKGEAPENENEILQENVSIGSILGVVTKLRILITKIRASPQRKERFKRQCVALNVKSLELIPDIRTRWNSTFYMIKRAFCLREPLHNLAAADKELSSYLLNSIEWDKLNEIQGLLECFQKATIEMSSENSPTLGQTVPIYNYLIDNIEDFLEETNTKSNDVINAANDAKSKLQQYYLSSDRLVYVIATSTNQNPLAAHISKKRKTSFIDELEVYLNEPPENFDMDVLAFWKVHENKFPNLSKMAKDFLAIPGTSVPVERVFSGGTDLITQRRCSLNPEIIRKSMCLKAWLKYKNKN
ncbi:zinc finger BED domain-containing protein DAYSLEEPER-like [Rhizophagus clarus]|uniref:Zinc finger BED domain-containing protein DAYSLEEPER-like n=1 Tax=Rhizophagus clarus TaxID=94130 RepID=A0A8H3QMP5_9GLOM|nr:zinc finger BED domain-containing protein DAYSLEEPER-like [Rhizophagus clarus]